MRMIVKAARADEMDALRKILKEGGAEILLEARRILAFSVDGLDGPTTEALRVAGAMVREERQYHPDLPA